jgi:hypothetical protein
MAPFNKREIGYIKAIADVGGHTTYKGTRLNVSDSLAKLTSRTSHDGKGKYSLITIGQAPFVYEAGGTNLKSLISDLRPWVHPHDVYSVDININEVDVGQEQRVTPECYLESVHTRLRMIQELDVNDDGASHQEYRMLVFRHKEKQNSDERYAENFSNPLYDMFLGVNNYKVGPIGYRGKTDINGNNDYIQNSSAINDVQSMMTNMVNKEDYVFMKDVRFYLGKEYGGKHIYEDTLHWNHGDPIATEQVDLSRNDSNNKNYAWYVFIVCTTNGQTVADFPYLRMDSTTHVTSG